MLGVPTGHETVESTVLREHRAGPGVDPDLGGGDHLENSGRLRPRNWRAKAARDMRMAAIDRPREI